MKMNEPKKRAHEFFQPFRVIKGTLHIIYFHKTEKMSNFEKKLHIVLQHHEAIPSFMVFCYPVIAQ